MRGLATSIPFVLLVLLSFLVQAQSKSGALKNDFWVDFQLTDRTRIQGLWQSCSEEEIIIQQGNETIQLRPEQIYKFEIRNENKTKRSSIIGAAIGFSIGAIIGATDSENDSRDSSAEAGYILGTGLLGAFSGGFIGFAIGMSGKTYYVLGKPEQYHSIQPSLVKYNRQD